MLTKEQLFKYISENGYDKTVDWFTANMPDSVETFEEQEALFDVFDDACETYRLSLLNGTADVDVDDEVSKLSVHFLARLEFKIYYVNNGLVSEPTFKFEATKPYIDKANMLLKQANYNALIEWFIWKDVWAKHDVQTPYRIETFYEPKGV